MSYKLISIVLLVSSFINTAYSSHLPSAVCFLTHQPSSETIEFAFQLAQDISSIDVFITVDDNNISLLSIPSSTVRFIQINETACKKYGFQQANTFGSGKTCSAWDKALYYFSKLSTHHSFVWFIEEDVFIPSIQAFFSLHELYSSSYDLVTAGIEYNMNGLIIDWPYWSSAPRTFVPPWAHGMVCAVGLSRQLLSAVNEYAQWQGHLTFIDFFFHTLAIQDHKMKVITPFELDTIVFRDVYKFEQVQARPNNWWHPIKNFTQQREWRNRLANYSFIDKKNIFIILNSIDQQLNDNSVTKSIYNISSQMMNLLRQFDIVKGQLTPSSRRLLRNRFLRLATNKSDILIPVAILLADHAFKLPYPIADKMMTKNKTSIRVKLEYAIQRNKQMILRLMKNENPTENERITIIRLRAKARRLILELTTEMQCEQQIIVCDPTRVGFELNDELSGYSRENFTNYLFALSIVLLCIMFIFFRFKEKKCAINKAYYLAFLFIFSLFFVVFIHGIHLK